MGWTFHSRYNSPSTYADEKAEILRLFTPAQGVDVTYEVLHAANVRPFWIVACRVTPTSPERAAKMRADSTYVCAPDGSYVFAAIIKTQRSQGEWGYKDMSEASGVYGDFSRVPLSLLEKLSPLKDSKGADYAREWRESIRAAHAAPKLKEGMRIRLATPVLFNTGHALSVYCTDFMVSSYTRRGKKLRAYIALDIGCTFVRLGAHCVQGFEVI